MPWRQELLYARSLLPPPSLRDARRNRRAGALKRAILALPSSPSSLLPTLDCRPLQSVHELPSPLFSLLPPPSFLLFRVFRGYISYRLAEQCVRERPSAAGQSLSQ